jgi:hypothetical protein
MTPERRTCRGSGVRYAWDSHRCGWSLLFPYRRVSHDGELKADDSAYRTLLHQQPQLRSATAGERRLTSQFETNCPTSTAMTIAAACSHVEIGRSCATRIALARLCFSTSFTGVATVARRWKTSQVARVAHALASVATGFKTEPGPALRRLELRKPGSFCHRRRRGPEVRQSSITVKCIGGRTQSRDSRHDLIRSDLIRSDLRTRRSWTVRCLRTVRALAPTTTAHQQHDGHNDKRRAPFHLSAPPGPKSVSSLPAETGRSAEKRPLYQSQIAPASQVAKLELFV